MADYDRPVPVPQPESDYYWEKAKAHELWLRKCNACVQAYFYPRDFCPTCHTKDVTWVQSSGKGTVYAFTIVHRSPPPFREHCPYVAAVVELDEGARMPSNIVIDDPSPDNLSIGMPVEVVFEDITDEISLPKFKPA